MMIHLPPINPAYAVVALVIGAIVARLLLMTLNVFLGPPADRERLKTPRPPCDWSKTDDQ